MGAHCTSNKKANGDTEMQGSMSKFCRHVLHFWREAVVEAIQHCGSLYWKRLGPSKAKVTLVVSIVRNLYCTGDACYRGWDSWVNRERWGPEWWGWGMHLWRGHSVMNHWTVQWALFTWDNCFGGHDHSSKLLFFRLHSPLTTVVVVMTSAQNYLCFRLCLPLTQLSIIAKTKASCQR